jgi:PAS domain S-box-containing protein
MKKEKRDSLKDSSLQEKAEKKQHSLKTKPSAKSSPLTAQENLNSSAQWDATFNAVTDGICIIDNNQQILRCNKAMSDLFPNDGEGMIGKPCWEVVHGTTRPIDECPVMKMKENLRRECTEIKLGDKWFDVTVDPLFGADNKLSGAVHIVRDITERNKAVEALQTNFALLRIAGESAKFGGWVLNLINKQITWSDEVAAIHEKPAGYSPLLDEGIHFYAPEWQDTIKSVITDCAKNGIPFDQELELITAKGNRLWVRSIGEAVRDENGKIFKCQGAFQDISERKLAEEALRHSEIKYRRLHETMMDGFVYVDMIGNIKEFNETYLKMLGYEPDEVLQLTYLDFTPLQWQAMEERIVKDQIIAKGYSEVYEKEYIRKDGTIFPVELRAYLVKNENGDNEGIWAIVRDITMRKLAEQALAENEIRLRELNATKDKFFSIIAHDLKSPFNSILGFSDLLVEQIEEKDYEGIDKYAWIIQNSSQRAMDLLSNLLEWSRSQTGRMVYSPEYIEIGLLINEVTELLQDIAQQKSISILKNLPQKAIVFADKAMIGTILRNLTSNAIKFTNPGGEVLISVIEKPGKIELSVRDNGIGINKGAIDKLFRIDENISTLGTQNERGTGLGLILCKDFVEKHAGRIWVESEIGKGSTFFFTLPTKSNKKK